MVDCETHKGSKYTLTMPSIGDSSTDYFCDVCHMKKLSKPCKKYLLIGARGIVILVCWVGFALYLLTGGWKQERSTGVEAKRRGRESVIDPKNHCQIRFCSPFVLPKNAILALPGCFLSA